MTLVSIIVPVYNVEPYIKRCLDSIINQTYEYLEIILVDDGSTDRSGVICDEYASKDKRIKVIHKENGGISSSRNAGLEIFTGDYVGFVDSDDWIEPSFIEDLLENNSGYDMVMCRFIIKDEDREYIPMPYKYNSDFVILTGDDVFTLMCTEKIDCSCCTKLFKRTLLKNVNFPIGKTNEDFIFLSIILFKTSKVKYLKSTLYYYIKRKNSITTAKFSTSQFDKVNNSFDIFQRAKKERKKLSSYARGYYVRQGFYLYKKILCDLELSKQYKNECAFLVDILRKNIVFTVFSKLFKPKEKLSILYSLLFPNTYQKKHLNIYEE